MCNLSASPAIRHSITKQTCSGDAFNWFEPVDQADDRDNDGCCGG